MADLVLNHCSVQSEWFQKYLEWDEKYKDFFITVEPGTDLSSVFRPRALPLLTPFSTADGEKLVWTTFSSDQVDLNYSNPEVLIEMISILFYYIQMGIQIIRLDAVAFLWKETGHTCLHHEKTHAVVKLFREIIKNYAPWVIIITETNVPHKDNLSYFGSGSDEAQMVYQFALPPLTLDAFIREDASHLREWAGSSLDKPSDTVSFFNFHASHDGVGVLPAKGILNESEIKNLLSTVEDRGGLISYKATKEGDIPYELNINYFSAIAGNEEDKDTAVNKFLSSQSVILAMTGMPGIYVHSLLGSVNYSEGVPVTGMNRTINREKLDYNKLEKELADPGTVRSRVLNGYKKMLDARRKEASFSPEGKQVILDASGPLLAVLRISPDGSEQVLCLVNVSGRILKSFPKWDFFKSFNKTRLYDIITGQESSAVILSPGSSSGQVPRFKSGQVPGREDCGEKGGTPENRKPESSDKLHGKGDVQINEEGSPCAAMLTLRPWEVVWLK
jgi:sucrose phosphorylase